ncbi:MAG: hypothetical protein DCE90_05830 [Pseudanabaena sp.]|nr:MAG: hypothetical protein DCE90_05830 [Pseudanabaena sp.]
MLNQVATVEGIVRWEIYHRLQDLEIPCKCSSGSPLTVDISSPNHLIQFWKISQRVNASRTELVQILENNWRLVD